MVIFVVSSYHGPAWQEGRGMREQPLWEEHRTFMNNLPDGFVVLGGPVDGHRHRAILVVRSASLEEAHRLLDPDPWVRAGVLVELFEPWEVLIGNPE